MALQLYTKRNENFSRSKLIYKKKRGKLIRLQIHLLYPACQRNTVNDHLIQDHDNCMSATSFPDQTQLQ